MSAEGPVPPQPWLALEGAASRGLRALQRDRTCEVVLGIAMAIYASMAMWLTRGTTLFIDGMPIFVDNRGLDLGGLLRPLNGHLVLLERLVYAIGFDLFGGDFVVFRLVEAVGVILAAGCLFVFLRRRAGPLVALAGALLILFLGSAWEVILLPEGQTN